jgi:tRNA threonylcarbamoyladenosine biosynthesis protein TsaE
VTRVRLADPEATGRLGARLAEALPRPSGGWTLLLNGDLGAGKSTLARAFLRALGHAGPVPSPTYTLVEPYDLGELTVYHVDLYRIGGEEELRYLGWNDLEAGLKLVEWADRAPGLAASADLDIRLAYDDHARVADLVALSERGRQWLADAEAGIRAAVDRPGV